MDSKQLASGKHNGLGISLTTKNKGSSIANASFPGDFKMKNVVISTLSVTVE